MNQVKVGRFIAKMRKQQNLTLCDRCRLQKESRGKYIETNRGSGENEKEYCRR